MADAAPSTPAWTLAPAQPADRAALAALIDTVLAASAALTRAQQALLRAHAEDHLHGWLDAAQAGGVSCHLLARGPQGEVVGMVLVREHWQLCSLYVAPHWQGRGLGRALVQAAWRASHGRTDRPLLRLVAAPGAEGFYRRLGFRAVRSLQTLPQGFVAMGLPLDGDEPFT